MYRFIDYESADDTIVEAAEDYFKVFRIYPNALFASAFTFRK